MPRDKLCVQRDDEMGFALADSYTLRVEFRPAGDLNWPPPELAREDSNEFYTAALNQTSPNSRNWVLTATIPNIYEHNQHRKPARLKVKKNHHLETATDFSLDIDTRWCTRVSSMATDRQEKNAMPSITVNDPRDHLQLSPPLVNGQTNGIANGITNGYPHGTPNGHTDMLMNGPHSPVNGFVNGHSGYLNGLPASPPRG